MLSVSGFAGLPLPIFKQNPSSLVLSQCKFQTIPKLDTDGFEVRFGSETRTHSDYQDIAKTYASCELLLEKTNELERLKDSYIQEAYLLTKGVPIDQVLKFLRIHRTTWTNLVDDLKLMAVSRRIYEAVVLQQLSRKALTEEDAVKLAKINSSPEYVAHVEKLIQLLPDYFDEHIRPGLFDKKMRPDHYFVSRMLLEFYKQQDVPFFMEFFQVDIQEAERLIALDHEIVRQHNLDCEIESATQLFDDKIKDMLRSPYRYACSFAIPQ